MLAKIRNFLREEEGVTAIEYGVIAALIIVVCLIAITAVGTNLSGIFNQVATALLSGSP